MFRVIILAIVGGIVLGCDVVGASAQSLAPQVGALTADLERLSKVTGGPVEGILQRLVRPCGLPTAIEVSVNELHISEWIT